MPDVKDTSTVIDSLRRCSLTGEYAGTDPGDTCYDCSYYGKCNDLELDAAELILLLDDLTDHQFKINRDVVTDLRHCHVCSRTGYSSECRAHNMYGSIGCDKIQSDAADILAKMHSSYMIGHALGRQNRPFFVKSPNGTWEPVNERIEPPIGTFPCDGFRGGKIYDVKTIHKEDMIDAMRYSDWISNEIRAVAKCIEEEAYKAKFEYPLTPKSIEQSADHKTVCVLWQDDSKTIVRLSDNDKDDIDTAFAYALAKKIFGTNTHLKKVVREHLNEHKPRKKNENG